MSAATTEQPTAGQRLAGFGRMLISPRGAVFLLLIVLLLNLTAILVRNRLRRKYQTSAF